MIPIFALLAQAASNLPSDASALERSISALESCISALDSSAEILANSSASLEPWSWVFTALVAGGVAMEFWVIWHEHREDTETWALTFFGVHRTLRPHFGRLIAEYISVALVAGGIIGELAVGIKIASFNTQLRGVDTQLRSKNAELRSKSDQLLTLVTQQAGDAETKLLRLQPRAKLLMGGCSFVKAVKPFAGQKIEIRTNFSGIKDPNDIEETRGFISSVDFLLGQVAGWSVSKAQGDNGWGITLAVRRTSSLGTRNAASALASAFGDCDLTNMQGNRPDSVVVDAGSVIDRENGSPDTIVLFIGERPH